MKHPSPALSGLLALGLLTACAPMKTGSSEKPPLAAACPDGVPAGARCLRGNDSENAPYLLVVPQDWNGVLVVHAHGGPTLGPPQAERLDEDIKRWSIIPRAGYAWAASTFRQGGVAVRSAAQDTERVRRIFVEHVARPAYTILHGQSWGASVAAKTAEMVSAPGMKSPYDAVMLTSGVLGGGTRSYDFRLDLRVVYQALCRNHPKPEEPQYPLWTGLPAGSSLTRGEMNRRVEDCLGLHKPAARRSAEQRRKVKTIVDVIRIPESAIVAHLAWGTWHFQDIALRRTGGLNPFGNDRVRYAGSADDAALNASVLRYRADPEGVDRFGADTNSAAASACRCSPCMPSMTRRLSWSWNRSFSTPCRAPARPTTSCRPSPPTASTAT